MNTQKSAVLKHDARAWHEGFAAGERGVLSWKCPHPAGSVQSWSWSSGHVEGAAKRDGYSYTMGAKQK